MSEATPRQVIFSGMAATHAGFSLWVRFRYRPRGAEAQAFACGMRTDPNLPRDIISKAMLEHYLARRRAKPWEWRAAGTAWRLYEASQRARALETAGMAKAS